MQRGTTPRRGAWALLRPEPRAYAYWSHVAIALAVGCALAICSPHAAPVCCAQGPSPGAPAGAPNPTDVEDDKSAGARSADFSEREQNQKLRDLRRGAASDPTNGAAGSTGGLRAVTWLIALLVIGGGGYWFLRRVKRGGFQANATRRLAVVARLPVSHKHQVLVVRVGRRLLVVGMAPDQLSRLAEISAPEEVVQFLPTESFGAVLADRNAQNGGPASGENSRFDDEPFVADDAPDIATVDVRTESFGPFRSEFKRLKDLVALRRQVPPMEGKP
ncbi:MAG: FliO/MopB family protein [Planctomycetota bacterium]